MPILWHTSFNGIIGTMTNRNNLSFTTGDSSSTYVSKGPVNYINILFGSGRTAADLKQPYISLWGRKAGTAAVTSRAFGGIKPSSWSPSSNCLALSMDSTSVGSYYVGWRFWLEHIIPAVSPGRRLKAWRFGFRAGRSIGTTAYNRSNLTIGPVNSGYGAAEQYYEIPYSSWGSNDRERYIELEWDPSVAKMSVYVDDVLVSAKAIESSDYAYGFTVMEYLSGPNSTAGNLVGLEIRDCYLQSIESASDVRLGSATTVVPVAISGDDIVMFDRPPGYNSNASVASLKMTDELLPVDSLSSSVPGAQDLYTIDPSQATSSLSSVEAVAVRSFASTPTTGERNFTALLAVGGTMAEQGDVGVAPTGGGIGAAITQQVSDPRDGSRWTLSKLSAVTVGTKYIG